MEREWKQLPPVTDNLMYLFMTVSLSTTTFFFKKGPFVMRTTCRNCKGAKMLIKHPCIECEGKGSVVQRKPITVAVPAGEFQS